MDLGTFFVDQIVVHDVPRNDSSTTPESIVFSDAPSPLNAELRNFFKGKTTQSLLGPTVMPLSMTPTKHRRYRVSSRR